MIDLRRLTTLTLTEPAEACRSLLGLQLSAQTIWTGFVLVQVLYTIVFLLQAMVLPTVDPLFGAVPPFTMLLSSVALQLSFAGSTTLCGRWMHGQGTFLQVLVCMSWLQFLQVAAHGALTVLSFAIAGIADLLSIVVALFAFYLSLHFVNEVHKLGSLWRAFGVTMLAGLLVFSLVILLVSRLT